MFYCRLISKCLITLVCGLLFCTLLMVLVYAIPNTLVTENAAVSAEIIEEQGFSLYAIPGYAPSYIDQFTDSVILGAAVPDCSDSLLENVLLNPCFIGFHPLRGLKAYLRDPTSGTTNYGRYWHGYLVYIKPLLIFFSISSIRLILGTVELLLIFLSAAKLARYNAVMPFFIMMTVFCIPALTVCLQYAPCTIIGLCSGTFILYGYGKKQPWLLFIITGLCQYTWQKKSGFQQKNL